MTVFLSRDTLSGEDALGAALTSTSKLEQIMGRGVAAGWVETQAAWVNAELNRPKAEPTDVLYALAEMQMQLFASVAAQLIKPSSDDTLIDLYVKLVRKGIPEHMRMMRDMKGKMS